MGLRLDEFSGSISLYGASGYKALMLATIELTEQQESEKRTASEPLPVPLPLPWQCLVDTGAQRTHVKEKVVNRLGILPADDVLTRDFDGNVIPALVYRVHISFGGRGKDIDVVAGGAPGVPHDVVIGADLLMHCILKWNGPESTFTIKMP